MHDVMLVVLAPLSEHTPLHVPNTTEYRGVPAQSAPPPLMTQLSAAAVSCRARCSRMSPDGLTQIASRAELSSFSRVLVIDLPQIDRLPPPALMTACVMFTAFSFVLAAACVPQKPGVRHSAPAHPSGGGLAGVDVQLPVAG